MNCLTFCIVAGAVQQSADALAQIARQKADGEYADYDDIAAGKLYFCKHETKTNVLNIKRYARLC